MSKSESKIDESSLKVKSTSRPAGCCAGQSCETLVLVCIKHFLCLQHGSLHIWGHRVRAVIDERPKSPIAKTKRNVKFFSPILREEKETEIPFPSFERKKRNLKEYSQLLKSSHDLKSWHMTHDTYINCWAFLIFMLMLMLDLWPQAETPGVSHFGAYHRSPDGQCCDLRALGRTSLDHKFLVGGPKSIYTAGLHGTPKNSKAMIRCF